MSCRLNRKGRSANGNNSVVLSRTVSEHSIRMQYEDGAYLSPLIFFLEVHSFARTLNVIHYD